MIRVVPSPSRLLTRLVLRSARRSSAASCSASCCSPISGATMSRIRRPRTRSSRGPNSAACATRWASASWSTSAGSFSAGSSSRAWVITCACATFRSPAPKAGGHTGPAPVQRLGERQVAPVRAVVATGVVGHQRRHVPGALSQSDVVGDRHHPQLQRAQLRLQPSQRAATQLRLSAGSMNTTCTSPASLSAPSIVVGTREHRMNGSTVEVELTCAPPANRRRTSGAGSHVSMQRACEQRT